MTSGPLATEPSPFVEIPEAARLAGMSVSNIRRLCARDGLGFKPGGKGDWRIRRATFERWMAGEALR